MNSRQIYMLIILSLAVTETSGHWGIFLSTQDNWNAGKTSHRWFKFTFCFKPRNGFLVLGKRKIWGSNRICRLAGASLEFLWLSLSFVVANSGNFVAHRTDLWIGYPENGTASTNVPGLPGQATRNVTLMEMVYLAVEGHSSTFSGQSHTFSFSLKTNPLGHGLWCLTAPWHT